MLLGVVSALAVETQSFTRCVPGAIPHICATCGTGPDAADAAARDLLAQGATILLSWGVAGALHPDLKPGQVVLDPSVYTCDGVEVVCPTPSGIRFERAVSSGGADRRLITLSQPVYGKVEKVKLFESLGMHLVDMESAGVARVCAREGIPFLAVRSIVDKVSDEVPAAFMRAIHQDGQLKPFVVLKDVIRSPWLLKPLFNQAMQFHIALKSSGKFGAFEEEAEQIIAGGE